MSGNKVGSKQEEEDRLIKDANRYRFLKKAVSGEFYFQGRGYLHARESRNWDKEIDRFIDEMDCDSAFSVGQKVLYSRMHRDQPLWVRQLYESECEIKEKWKIDDQEDVIYNISQLWNNAIINCKEGKLREYSKETHSCPFGAPFSVGISKLRIKLDCMPGGPTEFLGELRKIAILSKEMEIEVSGGEAAYKLIKVVHKQKSIYYVNGSVSSKAKAIKALEEIEVHLKNAG